MLALKDAVLEVYLYQKEANVIYHSPASSGYFLTGKSPWEAKRSFRYYCSRASRGCSAQLCLLTESRLGWLGCHGAVEASPCSCPDLPPWNMLYVRSRAVNKWCLPGAGDSRAAQCLLLSFLNFLGHGSPCVHVFINSPLPVHNPWGGLSFPLFTRERLANSWGDSSRQEEDFETTRVLHWKGN